MIKTLDIEQIKIILFKISLRISIFLRIMIFLSSKRSLSHIFTKEIIIAVFGSVLYPEKSSKNLI